MKLLEESDRIQNDVKNDLGTQNRQETLKWRKNLNLEINKIVTYIIFGIFGFLFFISIFYGTIFPRHNNATSIQNSTNFTETASNQVQISIFSIFLLLLSALAFGYLAESLKLPGLLGMLLVGLLIRNLDFLYVHFKIIPELGSFIRKFAFLIILLRAGLGLDPDALKRLKGTCIRLAIIPCSFEALAVAFASYFFLRLQIIYGLLLGFILAAVSPAVVVPSMLEIQAKNLGVDQGIPTLVTAAASIDDVYAITCFTLVFAVAKSGSIDIKNLLITIIRAPIEVFVGCLIGIGLAISCACLFGFAFVEFDSMGPIIVLVLGVVAAIKWRKQQSTHSLPEQYALKLVWDYFGQPLLFSLIGLQLSLKVLDTGVIIFEFLVLCIGLTVRILAAFVGCMGAGLNKNERLFIALAWLPKATVQAALAPILLDTVTSNPDIYTFRTEANIILTVGVLSILLTAPIGAFLIRFTAPILLKKPNHRNKLKKESETNV